MSNSPNKIPDMHHVMLWNDWSLIKLVRSEGELGVRAAQMLIYLSVLNGATTSDLLDAGIIEKSRDVTCRTINRALVDKGYTTSENDSRKTNSKLWKITSAGRKLIQKAKQLHMNSLIQATGSSHPPSNQSLLERQLFLTTQLKQQQDLNADLVSKIDGLEQKLSEKKVKPSKKKNTSNNQIKKAEGIKSFSRKSSSTVLSPGYDLGEQIRQLNKSNLEIPLQSFVQQNESDIKGIIHEGNLSCLAAIALAFISEQKKVTQSMLSKAGFYRIHKSTDFTIRTSLINRELVEKVRENDGIHEFHYALTDNGRSFLEQEQISAPNR